MRMPTLAVSMAMVVMLVGCGLFSDGQKAAEGEGAMTSNDAGNASSPGGLDSAWT